MLIAMMLGWEGLTVYKAGGIIFALVGGAIMLLLDHSADTGAEDGSVLGGNLCFLCNCVGTACYVIFTRILLRSLPPLTVVAGCYVIATSGMLVSTLLIDSFFLPLVCPDGCSTWEIPTSMLFALAFWVLGPSLTCYAGLSWGTKNADNTTYCLAYCALQPLTAFLLSLNLILLGWNDAHPGPLR